MPSSKRPPADEEKASKAKPRLDLSVKGSTGLPVWGGRIYDEYLPDLQGDRGRVVLREMSEQDPIIGGVLLGVEMLSRQVTWSVKPAEVPDEGEPDPTTGKKPKNAKKDKAEEVAEFVDGCLTDMHPNWENTLSEILSMLIYGWSWLEITYKRRLGLNPGNPRKNSRSDDGKIGWRSWSIRSQETLDTWDYENPNGSPDGTGVGELTGMYQLAPPNYRRVLIPRAKSLHFTTRSRRENPEGISMLRNCYRPWYMKKNIEAIEGIGIERDMAGLPVLWAPADLFSPEATDEDKSLLTKLQTIVTNIKRDEQEGVLMPMAYDEDGKNPLYKLELLSTGGDRQFDTNNIINRYDERIAMSMLADFILMGHQAVGSFALSTTKTGLFSTALSAILDLIAAEINMSAIPMLVRLNGYPLDMVPSLSHGKIETADLEKVGAYLKQLSDAGMTIFPNKPLEEYLLDTAGLPTDPDALGAGNLPFPDMMADPNAALGRKPMTIPTAGGARPVGGIAPGTQSGTNRSPAGRTRAPSTPIKSPSPSGQPKAASESTKARHFVPLVQRVARLREHLEGSMEPEVYKDFLASVMELRRFSDLSQEYQDIILSAEAR